MSTQRLVFIVNDAAFFISHRLPLALAAREQGFEVHVVTPEAKASTRIKEAGFTFHAIPLSRSGKNPIREIKSFIALYRLLNILKPDVLHLVTVKPIVYGGLAARILKVPAVVAAISGLGYVFTSPKLSARCLRAGVSRLYRLALGHKRLKVIFQNPDDRQLFLDNKACSLAQTVMIRGSGVDLRAYPVVPEPCDQVVVAMISRLLKDKGVLEYVAAATLLKQQGVQARFLLVGDSDSGNPAFINQSSLARWREEHYVEVLGFRQDIPQLIGETNLVVLPSYREGLPKILIEAAACGRAVITTDVPGCRDAIEVNQTGLLVPVRDTHSLAAAMKRLIENAEYRQQLGTAGRALAEQEFTIEHVVAVHLQVYQELTQVSQGHTHDVGFA